MLKYLLDANVCIGLIKGDKQLVKHLHRVGPLRVLLCSVVRAELFHGAWKSDQIQSNLRAHQEFVEPYLSLPFDDRAAEQYGIIRADLHRRGTPIGPNDLMIAAIAMTNDCTLVTRNSREFARVAGLRFETWDD